MGCYAGVRSYLITKSLDVVLWKSSCTIHDIST